MEFLRLLLRDVTIKDVANHDTYSNPGTQGRGRGWGKEGQNKDRVRTGHGKPGKSWNLIVGPLKSSKMKVLLGRIVTADDKARQGQLKIKRSSLTARTGRIGHVGNSHGKS